MRPGFSSTNGASFVTSRDTSSTSLGGASSCVPSNGSPSKLADDQTPLRQRVGHRTQRGRKREQRARVLCLDGEGPERHVPLLPDLHHDEPAIVGGHRDVEALLGAAPLPIVADEPDNRLRHFPKTRHSLE